MSNVVSFPKDSLRIIDLCASKIPCGTVDVCPSSTRCLRRMQTSSRGGEWQDHESHTHQRGHHEGQFRPEADSHEHLPQIEL